MSYQAYPLSATHRVSRAKSMHTSRPASASPSEPAWTDPGGAFALPGAELRELCHRLVDEWCDSLARLADEPVWRRPPEEVRARLATPLPRTGLGLARAYDAFRRDVLPYRYGNIHPRFWGWVNGSALPAAVLADFLASAMNSNVGAFDQSAVLVEEQVLGWMRELFGFPRQGEGLLTSGGSVANLLGLAAARHAHAPEVRQHGLGERRLTLYASVESHSSIDKAVELLGLGRESLRKLPVDGGQRLRLDALAEALAADRARGRVPFALVANAGTVNTGAIDPLEAIADLAAREALWLHVDAAYGGFFVLTGRARDRLAAIARADSVVLDPHKGLFLPYGCGAVLVREGERLRRGFAYMPSYLEDVRGEHASPSDYSPELTRHFRGARLWLSLELHGIERFRAALEEKLLLARLAQERLREMPGIEAGPEPQLSCVAFRAAGEGDAATDRLLARVLARGRVHLSSTRLDGRLWLRLCVLCFRSHRADVEVALEEIGAAAGR